MNATNHVSNGRRPNLGEQINRLDKILDGLSDGLNEAIAGAVRDTVGAAVKEAVQAVLFEVMSKPELLQKLQALHSQEQKPQPESEVETPVENPQTPVRGCFQRIACFLGELRQRCSRCLKSAGSLVAHLWHACMTSVRDVVAWCNQKRKAHGRSLFFATAAVGIGTIAWFVAPWIRANAGVIVDHVTTVLANLCTEERPSRRHRTC